ncbi:LuxR C-terminal-related transcriptional regulator [Streptomyces sp. G45]|uniref:helix-turn-helix transcriptional regulator n=1 Tax=Streptomyces sp. G45 TaxID=3406627 RepID=UPI003C283BE7
MRHDLAPGSFVARDEEQRRTLAAVLTKRGTAVVGPPGVGRTALLSAVTRQLNTARFEVVWTAATESSRHVPFGAFRGLLGTPEGLDDGQAYAALRAELDRRSGQRTPVLVIDDVHHLDDRSASLALGLAAEGRARLMVAARSSPTGAPPHPPVSDAVVALWKDGYLERLDLAPFGRADSTHLVRTLVNGEVAGTTAELLHSWTGGNPLFLTELVRHARVSCHLVAEGGLWWWRGPLTVPPRLAELFAHELAGLTVADQDVLAAVALGEPLPLPVLEAVAPAAVDRLEDLEGKGFVRTEDGTGQLLVRLGTPMLGAAVRQRLPRLRRRRLAAALLAACAGPTADPVVRARWQLDAHGPVDADLLIRAAEAARGHDPELACRLARRAREQTGAAAVPLARALVALGDTTQARDVLEQARADAASPGGRLAAAIALAAHRCWVDRDPAGADAHLAVLRPTAATPAAVAAIDGMRALVLLCGGHTGAALAVAERVLRGTSRGPGAACARLALAMSLALTGRTDDAIALAEPAAADRAAHAWLRESAAAVCAFAEVWRTSQARALAGDPAFGRGPDGEPGRGCGPGPGGPALPPRPAPVSDAVATLLGGYLQWVLGDRRAAVARLREAVVQHSGGGGVFRTEATCWLAVCLAEERRPEQAERSLAACPPDAVTVIPGQRHWARGAVAAARRDTAGAAAHLRRAVEAARAAGCWAVEVEYLTYAAWLAPVRPPGEVVDRLAVAVRHVDAPRLVAGAEAVLALSRGAGAELLDHAVRLDVLGMSTPAWRLAERAAAALRDQGRRHGDAVVLVSRLRDRLGVAAPNALPDSLTPREVEIASLAADGLSDRAISDRLGLSVRTVESHLTRIYRKLGVHSRRELPSALRDA